MRIDVICPECKKDFTTNAYFPKKFCWSCRNKVPKIERECALCSKVFKTGAILPRAICKNCLGPNPRRYRHAD